MASTFSPDLRIELIGPGDQAGTWGTTTNTNLGTIIESAIAGYVSVSVTSANQALTALDGLADQARNAIIALTTTTAANFAVYAPPASKQYIIYNTTAYTATVYNSTVLSNTTAAGLGVTVAAGSKVVMFSDGTNFRTVDVTSFLGVLPVLNGGTGQTSYTDGQLLIGNTTGNTLTKATLTAGANINVTNSAGGIAIAATGSVSSVDVSGGTTGLTTSGGPITGAGTITLAGTLATANGGTGQTSYTNGQLLIGNTTGNTLSKATLTAGSGISVTNSAGGITISATGGGGSGTVSSVDVSGGTTGLTTSGGPITGAGTITLAGTLATANGGTGQTSYTNGQLLIGNTTGNTLSKATLTAGSNITITNSAGGITISAGGGGVTSITAGTGLSGGTITTTGTIAIDSTVATLTGSQTLTNKTLTSPAITTMVSTGTREVRIAVPASNIDLATGNYFSRTISGATTLTVSNVPTTGTAVSFILDLTNGGSATITWWSGTKWAGGTAPSLTVAGRDVLGFFTYDGGTTWTGLLLGKDVK